MVTDAPAQAPLSGPTSPTHPQQVTAALTPARHHDGGIDLATIGLGIAGGVVAVGTILGATARKRRPQRRRVAA